MCKNVSVKLSRFLGISVSSKCKLCNLKTFGAIWLLVCTFAAPRCGVSACRVAGRGSLMFYTIWLSVVDSTAVYYYIYYAILCMCKFNYRMHGSFY